VAKKRAAEHADERWLLTYADMITLLMALFMVLFSIAVVNKGKFDQLAKSLRESFSGPLGAGANAVLQTNNPAPQSASAASSAPAADQVPTPSARFTGDRKALATARALAGLQAKSLLGAKAAIDSKIAQLHLGNAVKSQIDSRGLVITLVTDKALFDVGSAVLKPGAGPLLRAVAAAINGVGANPIRVNGHTDAIPFFGNPHGNEVLSGARANAVLFFMEDHGFSVKQHPDSASAGFGAREPLIPNDNTTGAGARNRRVEVIVERIDYVAKTQAAANGALGTNPVGLPTIAPSGPN
jgi:chemotaxis protein MotB